MKTNKHTIICFLLVFPLIFKAQNPTTKCVSTELFKKNLEENPQLLQQLKELELQINNNQQLHLRDADLIIPVVVHVIYRTNLENISDQQVHSQIQALNRDFNKENNDVENTPSVFSNVVADCGIRFQLVSRDPEGKATTGIVRHQTTKTYWNVSDEMKIPSKGGFSPWNPAKYLNIYVCNMGGKSLGFSSFPGMPAFTDGIVIDFTAFGTTGTVKKPYHLGRTCVHEVGHWFGLFHIWGDVDCGNDYVEDTPTQKMEFTGCPPYPQYNTCKGVQTLAMSMNFMDYVNDECMLMFTNGQKMRMRGIIQKKRSNLSGSDALLSAENRNCTIKTIQAKNIHIESVDIDWEATAGVAEYTIEYKAISESIWHKMVSKTPYATLNNLEAGKTYEAKVKTDCDQALFSSTAIFTTTRIALRSPSDETEIQVFPNPVNNRTTISILSEGEYGIKVTVSDISGQVKIDQIYEKYTPSVQLDFSALPQGMYVVSIVKNGKRAVSKVLKVRE